MKALFYLHQLPQNILGLLVIFFSGAMKCTGRYEGLYITDKYRFGVSLGNYIIFGGTPTNTSIKHEQGHQKQSLYFGWLYLLVVGLPSVCRNIWDRIAHTSWANAERLDWYFDGYPEKWADKLGGVKRY